MSDFLISPAGLNGMIEGMSSLIIAFLLAAEIPRRKIYNTLDARLFFLMLVFCEIMLVSDIVNLLSFVFHVNIGHIIGWPVFCVSYFVIMLIFSHYVLMLARQKVKVPKLWTAVIDSACTFGMAVWLISGFADLIVVHGPDGLRRGPLFPLLLVPGPLISALIVLAIIRYRRAIGQKNAATLMVYVLMLVGSAFIPYWLPPLRLQYTSVAYAVLLFYLMIHSDREHQLRSALERSRAELAVSQIKPHFIFNTLNAIYYLCEEDPQKAQTGIADFSDYLRRNIDSVEITEPVPFADELEHIHHYLDIQRMRFGDQLNVKLDLETVDFTVPVLTVEPLVENAVRYGMAGRGGRCEVCISTRTDGDMVQITISDNGDGFDTAGGVLDGPGHLGIRSVQSRISQMPGGSFEIKSSPGEGTVAAIRLRKEI